MEIGFLIWEIIMIISIIGTTIWEIKNETTHLRGTRAERRNDETKKKDRTL